jgi:hypothetical protein
MVVSDEGVACKECAKLYGRASILVDASVSNSDEFQIESDYADLLEEQVQCVVLHPSLIAASCRWRSLTEQKYQMPRENFAYSFPLSAPTSRERSTSKQTTPARPHTISLN